MNETLELLVRHGAAIVFVWVFLEQLGVPLPSAPCLMAAGALAVAGKINGIEVLGAATVGSSLADLIWFYLGRYGGNRILRLLCRISLEPDSCVRRTSDLYTRYGMRGVVAAKFIPGLSTIAPPLAGNAGVSTSRFLMFDGLGSFLYTGFFIGLGALFSRQLDKILSALASLGSGALVVVVGAVVLYLGNKFYQRHRLLRELQTARITVDELYQKQETGENPIILDLRSQAEVERDPALIRSARHITVEQLQASQNAIPHDKDIILYCSCPNEVSSARMALMLQRNGVLKVRPLVGGLDAWRERKYPTELHVLGTANLPDLVSTNENPSSKT